MAEPIDIYKKKRTTLRTSVTKMINRLEGELVKPDSEEDTIEELLEQLNDLFIDLKKNDKNLEQLLKKEDLDKEMQSAEEYREKIISCRFKAKKRLNILNKNNTVLVTSPDSTLTEGLRYNTEVKENHLKLPKIALEKFYGDPSKWLTFWNSYETTIHENVSLDKVNKFIYLKSHLGGTALESISGFAISSENYDKAVIILKERFGRQEILINSHMNNLLQIPPLKRSNDIKNFRKLVDKCQTEIRSLESLGINDDSFGNLLCPLILKLLPHDLVLNFNKEYDRAQYSIHNLINFLSKQLSAYERTESGFAVLTQQNSVGQTDKTSGARSAAAYSQTNKIIKSTVSDLLYTDIKDRKYSCVFCNDSNHKSSDCEYARNLSVAQRKSILLKRGACFSCFKLKHLSRDCKSKIICKVCGHKHFDLMCLKGNNDNSNSKIETYTVNENTIIAQNSCSKKVYLETLIADIHGKGFKHLIRIIIDTGSQKSYISEFAATKMKLKNIGEEMVVHGLFGGIERTETHKRYRIKLSSIDKKYSCEFEAMDQKKICASIPKIDDDNCIRELKALGIYVSDIEVNEKLCLHENDPNEIHLLIGADMAGKLLTGNVKHFSEGLTAVHTFLGWTVMGRSNQDCKNDSSLLVLSLHVNNAKISDLWNLDTLGIKDLSEQRSKTETQELALKHFKDTVSRDEKGRYQVCLPWLEGHLPVSDHKELAIKRLKNTVNSLKIKNKLKDYQEVFNEWEREGIIEQITPDIEIDPNTENLGVHFLPHRAVFKQNSTTKIRPVFDGSAKTSVSVSLNECLEKGPNLIELIPSVINRFRWGKIGVVADIRKAFLQISLNKSDRDFLRFMWWKDGDPGKVITYRHCRVVFGISSSPFLLAAVLTHHLDQVQEPLKEFAKILKESMYIDNCVASVESFQELKYFRSEAQKILSSAGFDLRGWTNNHLSNSKKNEDLNTFDSGQLDIPVLGLSWNLAEDCLSCTSIDTGKDDEPVTKRRILSIAHRIFDPIGFTCPITLIPKLLLQECWKIEATWDSNLPEDVVQRFKNWKIQLQGLKDIKIPRRFSHISLKEADLSLHIFCDASRSAYATCIFFRIEKNNEVTCQLIQSRSRVAPLKNISIPRLELLACCIGVRLADSVKKDLHLENVQTTYWSDSMDALFWIKKNGPWGIFVSNRVKEIRNLSPTTNWKYVQGNQNPADLPSRGSSVKTLIKKKWWEGPLWLRGSKEEWPDFEIIPNEEIVNSEKKKIIVSSLNNENDEFYHRISSFRRIIRITGWIFRFFENSKASEKKSGELSAEEIKKAELVILKRVQKESFYEERNKNLKSLTTFTDADGLIRTRTKIYLRDDEENFRFPIVLPSDHHVVKCLIIWKHKELGHAGVQYLMAALRENWWILKSRRTIKKAIKTCTICQRFSVKPPEIPEGPLPEDRVNHASVFEVIGVDVAGPLIIKDDKKTWILILTCAIYRAVHLELLTSLSTDNFLLALRRFIARRGRPSIIYSDNAKNFVGAENLLKNIDFDNVRSAILPITWKFIPPNAPWWGGFWERLVGLMKQTLKKVIGKSSLNYEELITVLCDCECIINSRPLTFVSEDVNDLNPITPAMFLQENNNNNNVLDLDRIDQLDRKELNKRLAYRQRILKDLRARFRLEYLGQLRQTTVKKTTECDPKVGDIILVQTDNMKRINWPLGKIIEIYPSKDGTIRMAKIKTKSGALIRPLRKLCFLELDQDSGTKYNDCSRGPVDTFSIKDMTPQSTELTTRAGRIIRVPNRYRL